jgi:hypothetical protein
MPALAIRGVWLLPAAIMAVAVVALGGCGAGPGGPTPDGPLSLHDSIPVGASCAPGGHSWAFGLQQFTNSGGTTVVLDRVRLLHPRNERLIGSFAVPGAVIVGEVRWPPKYPGTLAGLGVPAAWKHRQPVHGFRLAPGATFNLVLGIAAVTQGRRASSKGILIYYHSSSGRYVVSSSSENLIAAGPSTKNCLS